jgi:hypothetical protein
LIHPKCTAQATIAGAVMSGGELATEFLYFVLVIHLDKKFLWRFWRGVFQKRYKR